MIQGYLFIAIGRQYIDECVLLANTLRKNGDNRPISLLIELTEKDDRSYARSKNIFDQLITFEPQDDIYQQCLTNFEKYCLYPRINFDKYIKKLNYDEIIIVDSDVLCQYSTENLWNYLSQQPIPIRMLGRYDDPNWHWGTISEVSDAFGKHVPHVHGGFFYIRKDNAFEPFFKYCREVFYKYDGYKCKRFFRGGRVDEIIFAIAHANFNVKPLEFDEFPVMTFNYTPNIQIPSKLQTEGDQNIEMMDYIPFVHMFDKMTGDNFKSLYEKIMQK